MPWQGGVGLFLKGKDRMIICEAKVASEEKAVKGFRGINPQAIHPQPIYSTIP